MNFMNYIYIYICFMNYCNADGLTISKVESMPCRNYEIPTCKNCLVLVELVNTT